IAWPKEVAIRAAVPIKAEESAVFRRVAADCEHDLDISGSVAMTIDVLADLVSGDPRCDCGFTCWNSPQQRAQRLDDVIAAEESKQGAISWKQLFSPLRVGHTTTDTAPGPGGSLVQKRCSLTLGTAQELFPIGRSYRVVPLWEGCVSCDSQLA